MLDKARGKTEYQYTKTGQLQGITQAHFSSDAAGNFLPTQILPNKRFALHNRITDYGDIHLSYDEWGNVNEKAIGLNKYQRFSYDCENRLIKAQTYVNDVLTLEGKYTYDSLGRRIKKESINLQNRQTKQTTFLWQGLRLLQEQCEQKRQTYIYETDNYAPLARIDTEYEVDQLYYYHTDQIGTPLELTNEQGTIVWQANYKTWGEIDSFTVNEIEQNLRYQGQYFDEETELHYNTFRYYDPQVGRFTTQDPIGLLGGDNLYAYALNPVQWIDTLGWCGEPKFNSQKKFTYKEGEMSVMKHIRMGHAKDALQSGTSKFSTNSVKKISSYITEALEKGTVSSNGKELIYEFSRNIGTNIEGLPTNTIKLFIDSKGWVRTAFPL